MRIINIIIIIAVFVLILGVPKAGRASCCHPWNCIQPVIYEERYNSSCDNDPSEVCSWTVWIRYCGGAACDPYQTCTCTMPTCYIYYGAYPVIGCNPCGPYWISINYLWAVVYGDPDCDESKCFFNCQDNELPWGSNAWSLCPNPPDN